VAAAGRLAELLLLAAPGELVAAVWAASDAFTDPESSLSRRIIFSRSGLGSSLPFSSFWMRDFCSASWPCSAFCRAYGNKERIAYV